MPLSEKVSFTTALEDFNKVADSKLKIFYIILSKSAFVMIPITRPFLTTKTPE
jgi:hypothetical protein